MPTLTQKQCSVLWGLSAGLAISEIAKRLKVSPATVSGHRNQLGRIYESKNIVQLLRAAVADEQIPKDVLARPVPSLLKKVA